MRRLAARLLAELPLERPQISYTLYQVRLMDWDTDAKSFRPGECPFVSAMTNLPIDTSCSANVILSIVNK